VLPRLLLPRLLLPLLRQLLLVPLLRYLHVSLLRHLQLPGLSGLHSAISGLHPAVPGLQFDALLHELLRPAIFVLAFELLPLLPLFEVDEKVV
jgi:hypothetical protein